MNALDAAALFLVMLFLGLGIYHGLIRSMSSLVSIFAGLYLAKILSPGLAHILSLIHLPGAKGLIGFSVVFLFFFTAIKIAFHFMEKFTRKSVVSTADRVLGGILGMVKGTVIIVFIAAIMQIVLPRDASILKESQILPAANKVIITAKGLVPDDLYRHVHKTKG